MGRPRPRGGQRFVAQMHRLGVGATRPVIGFVAFPMPRYPSEASGSITVGAHRVRFLRDGAVAFPAMLEAIGNAECEVVLEMYWFGADNVG